MQSQLCYRRRSFSWRQFGLAVECLWDCEPRVRATACQVVNPDVPGVRERLGELANDSLDDDDDDDVRVYARQALGA